MYSVLPVEGSVYCFWPIFALAYYLVGSLSIVIGVSFS